MNDYPPESLPTSAVFWVYELAFAAGFVVFAPYALFRMARTPAFRAGVAQRLSLHSNTPSTEEGLPIWVQAVSLGEVKSVAPLIRKMNARGGCPVFLTTTTHTGFRVANELLGRDNAVAYFPLDFSLVVKRMLARVKPRAVVLFETEIWPNFIRAAGSLRIPMLIVNGRISERSFKLYRLVPRIFKNTLSRISFAGMQSAADADRITALGAKPEAVKICGNMKFDAAPAPPPPEEIESIRKELMLPQEAPLIVAGSTHQGEERAISRVYREILSRVPNTRLLVAPRHPERFEDAEIAIRAEGFKVWRRSRPADDAGAGTRTVILLDTIGELARVYALASVSFVGGSLAKVGGHNIIEPASMGKAVLFGPHMYHFEDIKEAFLSEKAAVCVRDQEELLRTIRRLLEQPSEAEKLGNAARRVVDSNRGATDRYFRALERYLGPS